MIRESAYQVLNRVAQIQNKQLRRDSLREVLANSQPLATLIQYAYHPDVQWDLPTGTLPDGLVTRRYKHDHDDYSVMFSNIRKLPKFFVGSPVAPDKKLELFAGLIRDVTADDADLLLAIKDKKLPWKTLNQPFVAKAIPELFPPTEQSEEVDEPAEDE